MDVPLVVSNVLTTSLIVEPIEEVATDLSESGVRDDVRLSIVLVGCSGQYSTVYVS